jgi:hypothetical protein
MPIKVSEEVESCWQQYRNQALLNGKLLSYISDLRGLGREVSKCPVQIPTQDSGAMKIRE